MRFANFLNEAYSKELSNALRRRGLAKEVGDLLADSWNISIAKSKTYDVSNYVDNGPKPIKNVIARIRREPYDIYSHRAGILIFVHTTDGITCCYYNDSGEIPSSRDLSKFTTIGDVSGDVESCYIIEASSEDRRSYSSSTKKLKSDRRENKNFTDSTAEMSRQRKYKMDDINIGRGISKNKLTNKIQTLLEDFDIIDSGPNAGSIFVTQRQRGDKTIYILHGLRIYVKCDIEDTRIDVYSKDSFDGWEEDCLDKEAKIEFEISGESGLRSFKTESDNLSDHLKAHETYIQLIKTLIKIRELLKGKTWGDLLI